MIMTSTCKDSNLMERILPEDPSLFDDLLYKNKESSDIDPFLKRIKNAKKLLVKRINEKPRETTLADIKAIISVLLSCLWKCSENMRLGREIDKFLASLWPLNSDLIKSTLTSQLLHLLFHTNPFECGLAQVSSVLDVSVDIRNVFKDHLTKILQSMQSTMNMVLTEKPVSSLTNLEHKLLYAIVKLSLLIFQYYPEVISQNVWSHDATQNDLQPFLKVITSWLIYILHTPCFSLDCTLLSGMTMMFLLNTAPSPEDTSSNFWRLLNLFTEGADKSFDLGRLRISCKTEKKAENSNSEDNSEDYRLGHLALLRGFVMSASTTTLLHSGNNTETGEKMSNKTNLMKLFQSILHLCNGAVNLHYLSFQLLSKWFQKLLQILTKSNIDVKSHIIESQRTVLTETWHLIKINSDSPVDNVAEFSIEICRLLLEFQKLIISKTVDGEEESVEKGDNCAMHTEDLVDVILHHIVDTSWTLKSRYKLLKILIPYTENEKIRGVFKRLTEDLLLCLSTNNLAACANDVYKTWIHKDRVNKEELERSWITHWWQFIHSAITSQHSLLRYNAMIYLIPTTLKTAPELAGCLHSQITTCLESTSPEEERNRVLHAGVSVMKVIRSVTPGFKMLETTPISEALFHHDDDIRSEAIGVLCTSLKTAEPLGSIETEMLMQALPLNLNIDSASFRQSLIGDMKKLCVRCRDSALSALKSLEKNNDILVRRTLDFTDCLLRMCVTNLRSGVSFQRKKTCLEIYQNLLQTFTRFHESKHKRGQDQETMIRLMELANQWKLLDLCSFENWMSVLHCVTDNTDEVQNLASNILMKYFPSSILKELDLFSVRTVIEILSHGLGLCNTAWSPDNSSGSLLCELIWTPYISEEGWTFNIEYCETSNSYRVSSTGIDKANSSLRFIKFLVSEIKEGLLMARHAPLQASRTRPIQGHLKLLNALIGEKHDINVIPADNLLPLLQELSSLCLATSQLMAAILAGGEDSNVCVSFADVASSLESLLPSNQNCADNDVNLLHTSYRPLLTWCATNTKESMVCLGRVIQLLIRSDPKGDHLDIIERLGSEFISVFTRNRHWGAIDGCRLGFYKYCITLFSSSSVRLCSLPQQLLRQVLENLTSSTSASSVTRRSAGLPVLIQTVVLSEKCTRRTECLTMTMETLLSVASSPVSGVFDQTLDLPQVHAINMLNTLFTDVALVSHLVTYISRALILVINGFSSTSWAIRNSATLLFSTLISRVFGQKKSASEGNTFVNSITVTEFCAHYPEICPLIVTKLEGAKQDGLHSITHLPTVLFPVLSILSNLAPQTLVNSFSDSIRDIVSEAAYSPVFSLRELAAKAYPALLVPSQRLEIVKTLLISLSAKSSTLKTNYVHGVLLQVEKLLETENNRDCKIGADILTGLLDNDWILFDKHQSCDLVKAKYIEVIMTGWNSLEVKELLKSTLENLLERCLQFMRENSNKVSKVCDWLYVEMTLKLLVSVYDWTSDYLQNHLSAFLTDSPCLRSASVNTIKHCLLSTTPMDKQAHNWHQIQGNLIKCLIKSTERNEFSEYLELILNIHRKYGSNKDGVLTTKALSTTLSNDLNPNSTMAAQVLEFSAICFQKQIETGEWKLTEVDEMTEMMLSYSQGDATERQQMASARSLLTIGTHLFTVHKDRRRKLEAPICRLMLSTLNLLHNIQPEIRDVTGKFVNSLPHSSSQNGKLFYDLLVSDWSWSNVCVRGLLDRLYLPGEITQRLDPTLVITEPVHSEMCIEAFYLHITLKAILKKRSNSTCEELLETSMKDVMTDLEKCVQLTSSKPQVLFHPGRLELSYIFRCLLLCDLLINITTPDSTTKQKIYSALQELSQVTVLENFYGDVLQTLLKNFSLREHSS